jgi:hypothetical protein
MPGAYNRSPRICKRYADLLRGYLGAKTIGPLPVRRLAAAHPQTVNAVFRKVLRQPTFTWAEHGEALLRRRKPWYYGTSPVPTSPCSAPASPDSSASR